MSAEKSKMVATYQAEKKKLKVSFPIQDMIFFFENCCIGNGKVFLRGFFKCFSIAITVSQSPNLLGKFASIVLKEK